MKRALAPLALLLCASSLALADIAPEPGPLDGGSGTLVTIGAAVAVGVVLLVVAGVVMKKKKASPDDPGE